MSKSTVEIGNEFEKKKSISFHSSYTPLLVSAKLLRSKGLGQIDLSRYNHKNKLIEVGEAKKFGKINKAQTQRLVASANFLSALFNKNSKLILIHASH